MSKQAIIPNTLQLIRCFIGEQTYCLDTFWVIGVQNADELLVNKDTEVPIGWTIYEQQKVPIFSLALQLKLSLTQEIFQSKIIIFNSKPLWGILVDKVSRVFEVEKENLFSLPELVENSSVSAFQGIVKIGDEMLLYLAPQFLHPKSPSKQFSNDKKNLSSWAGLIEGENKGQYRGQLLSFSIGNHKDNNDNNIVLGLSITQVLQVLKSAIITPIPMSPNYVLGFVNWQNFPICVIDLNLYLGMESELIDEQQTRILIARSALTEGLIAILIQPLVKTLNLPFENNPTKLPFLTNKPFSIKSFELREEVLVILDIDGIIGLNTALSIA